MYEGGGPGVVLSLFDFVLFSTGLFSVSLTLLSVLVFFSVLFCIVINSLGEERTCIRASRVFMAFVCFIRVEEFLSFFSVSWCQGLIPVCDCGTPWTFLLTLLQSFKT